MPMPSRDNPGAFLQVGTKADMNKFTFIAVTRWEQFRYSQVDISISQRILEGRFEVEEDGKHESRDGKH